MAEEKDIEMHDSSDSNFQIFVRIVTGSQYRTFTINTSGNEQIANIAQQLAHKTGVDPQNIVLSYQSKILSPDHTNNYYHISRESTLNASIRCSLININGKNHGHCFGAFPCFVSNKQLMDEIKSIDHSINDLINQYQHKITNSNSLHHLNKIWNEDIKNKFNAHYNKMQQDKLEKLKQINSNNNDQKSSIEVEVERIRNGIFEINTNIKNIDDKIKGYKQMIKQCKDEKTQSLIRKITQKNELEKRLKSNQDIINECKQRNKEIISIENEPSSNALSYIMYRTLIKWEVIYNEWSNKDVIEWIKIIENGRFNDDKYKEMTKEISRLEIDGNKLEDLRNESILKLIGLNLMERKVLLKNIDRVINKGNNGQNSNICTVCTEQRINSVFIPCGHQSCCYQCYEKEKHRFINCPICRKEIKDTVKTFMNGFK